ncbi:spondin domain-containing protein [Alteromonadaceae bacterium BrNp21-10]|nr:spondin domain-containing protein [Alteromonadaceae bacterium BrNp21-10]
MKTIATLGAVALAVSSLSHAAELDITVQNLTQGIYFTPLLISAHPSDASFYKLGEMASGELQAMAEGGDISGLMSIADGMSANSSANPAEGMLAPSTTVMTSLSTDSANTHLSLMAMLLPTNDGFVGLDSWEIPSEAGTYHFYLNGYDAGTEANDEMITGGGAPGAAGIPKDPAGKQGMNATGVTDMETNMMIHVHRGNLGDDMMDGGKSDLNNTVHRWLNPVAKVTVTVN